MVSIWELRNIQSHCINWLTFAINYHNWHSRISIIFFWFFVILLSIWLSYISWSCCFICRFIINFGRIFFGCFWFFDFLFFIIIICFLILLSICECLILLLFLASSRRLFLLFLLYLRHLLNLLSLSFALFRLALFCHSKTIWNQTNS